MSEHAYVVLFVSVSVWEDPCIQYMDMQNARAQEILMYTYMDMCGRVHLRVLYLERSSAGVSGKAVHFSGMWVESCERVSVCTREGAW